MNKIFVALDNPVKLQALADQESTPVESFEVFHSIYQVLGLENPTIWMLPESKGIYVFAAVLELCERNGIEVVEKTLKENI